MGKRKALPGGINKKMRAALRSIQAGQLAKQKELPIRRLSIKKSTYGLTNVETARRLLSDPVYGNIGLKDISNRIVNARVMRILNASSSPISNKSAQQILGKAGKIMDQFAGRVPKWRTIDEHIPGPKRYRKNWEMKRFMQNKKEAEVYIENYSLEEKYAGEKPDLLVRILNEKEQGIPFLPPRTGSIVNENLQQLNQMAITNYPPESKRYVVMGWILFQDYYRGKGSVYHLQAYLKKSGS